MTIFIGIIIVGYAGFVIYRKLKDMKQGKYCGCGCDHCISKCNKKEESKDVYK